MFQALALLYWRIPPLAELYRTVPAAGTVASEEALRTGVVRVLLVKVSVPVRVVSVSQAEADLISRLLLVVL